MTALLGEPDGFDPVRPELRTSSSKLILLHIGLCEFAAACESLISGATYLLPRQSESLEMPKLGNRDIARLGPNSEIWDPTLAGFGARRQRSAAVSYVVIYRNDEGRQRRFTIGRHGSPYTPDTARREAQRIIGLARSGHDPAHDKRESRKASTVAELCDDYLADVQTGRLLIKGRKTKKASTISIDRTRIERHVKPLLGRLKVKAVTRGDIDKFMHDVAAGATAELAKDSKASRTTGGPGTASRTVGMLGAVFDYAVKKHIRDDNPCRGVQRFSDGKRDRRLTDAEYGVLGSALMTDDVWPPALVAIRFLALTGWRRGEMLDLTWSNLDLSRQIATLPDTKTGRSVRPLSSTVCSLLSALPRSGSFTFPAMRGDGRMSSFANTFVKVIAAGGLLPDVTPHVLRHTFASIASDLGYSEATIGALIGHVGQTMTSRYIHSADAVLLAATEAVAARIGALLDSRR